MIETSYLLDGRVKLSQNADGYRAGMDAVFLAAACPIESGEKLLDLGCGASAAALCVAARVADIHVTGIEIQPEQAELARENFNSLLPVGRRWPEGPDEGRVEDESSSSYPSPSPHPPLRGTLSLQGEGNFEVICADIKTYPFPADHFDHVIMNPPYHNTAQHDAPVNEQRAASFMIDDLAAWIGAARRAVKTHGSITIIHRTDALADILALMQGFGAVEIIPLWPRAGEAADRIIIRARKGRKTPMALQAGIVLHEISGNSTETARAILRGGVKIP